MPIILNVSEPAHDVCSWDYQINCISFAFFFEYLDDHGVHSTEFVKKIYDDVFWGDPAVLNQRFAEFKEYSLHEIRRTLATIHNAITDEGRFAYTSPEDLANMKGDEVSYSAAKRLRTFFTYSNNWIPDSISKLIFAEGEHYVKEANRDQYIDIDEANIHLAAGRYISHSYSLLRPKSWLLKFIASRIGDPVFFENNKELVQLLFNQTKTVEVFCGEGKGYVFLKYDKMVNGRPVRPNFAVDYWNQGVYEAFLELRGRHNGAAQMILAGSDISGKLTARNISWIINRDGNYVVNGRVVTAHDRRKLSFKDLRGKSFDLTMEGLVVTHRILDEEGFTVIEPSDSQGGVMYDFSNQGGGYAQNEFATSVYYFPYVDRPAVPFFSILDKRMTEAILRKKVNLARVVQTGREAASRAEDARLGMCRTNYLINQVMPPIIASEMHNGRPIEGDTYGVILFADISGFTSVSESMADFNDRKSRITPFYRRCSEQIQRSGGFALKFEGDCVVGVFGVPHKRAFVEADAVLTGLDMLGSFGEFCGRLGTGLRVGINNGEFSHFLFQRPGVKETIGAETEAGTFDICGATVNIAARVEGAGLAGVVTLTEDMWGQVSRFFHAYRCDEIQEALDFKETTAARSFIRNLNPDGTVTLKNVTGIRYLYLVDRVKKVSECDERTWEGMPDLADYEARINSIISLIPGWQNEIYVCGSKVGDPLYNHTVALYAAAIGELSGIAPSDEFLRATLVVNIGLRNMTHEECFSQSLRPGTSSFKKLAGFTLSELSEEDPATMILLDYFGKSVTPQAKLLACARELSNKFRRGYSEKLRVDDLLVSEQRFLADSGRVPDETIRLTVYGTGLLD